MTHGYVRQFSGIEPMDGLKIEDPQSASKILKALANDNRLVIVCALANGELNVGELENILEIHQPTLSQQLARLRGDGIVTTRRDSKHIYYKLASEEAERVIRLLCLPRKAKVATADK